MKKRQYKRMIKKYYKRLVSKARYAGKNPFDAELGIELLAIYIKYMQDYYELGENVHAEEIEGHDRYTTLAAAYDAYELGWDINHRLSKRYYELHLIDEETALVDTDRPLFGLTKEAAEEQMKAKQKEYQVEFFRIVSEEYHYWWD